VEFRITVADIRFVYEHTYPASHVHWRAEVLPAREWVLLGQLREDVEDGQYILAEQAGHWVPLPGVAENVPGRHWMQVEELTARNEGE